MMESIEKRDSVEEIGRQDKRKYKQADSMKMFMKTEPVEKIIWNNIMEGCGITRQTFGTHLCEVKKPFKERRFKLILQFCIDLIARETNRFLSSKFQFLPEMYGNGFSYMDCSVGAGRPEGFPYSYVSQAVEGYFTEVTINHVITQAEKTVNLFACADTHDIPVVAVVDPEKCFVRKNKVQSPCHCNGLGGYKPEACLQIERGNIK